MTDSTNIFRSAILYINRHGGTVTVLSLILVAWRLIDPDVLESWSSGRLIYVAVFAVALVAAAVAGFYGGKLIQFPGDDKL